MCQCILSVCRTFGSVNQTRDETGRYDCVAKIDMSKINSEVIVRDTIIQYIAY